MAYIGQSLTEGTRREYSYVATAGQTVFPAVYTVGAVDVHQNGILLPPSDYTATDGTTVVFATGCAVDDEVVIHCHNTFSVADTVSASAGGTFNSDVTVVGDLTVDTDTLYVDATNNRVGIGTSSPAQKLHLENASAGAYAQVTSGTSSVAGVLLGDTLNNSIGRVSYDNADNSLQLWTSSTERLRIDSSGNLLVGKTAVGTPNDGFQVSSGTSAWAAITNSSTSSVDELLFLRRNGGDGEAIQFSSNGTTVGTVTILTTGTIYSTTSDRRLKTDIQPIADATDKLMAMNPVSHKWKADPEADAVVGFIAQEMQEIVPEAVSGTPDGEEMMSMDYGRITPVLVAALQDAHKKIKVLEQRLTALEAN